MTPQATHRKCVIEIGIGASAEEPLRSGEVTHSHSLWERHDVARGTTPNVARPPGAVMERKRCSEHFYMKRECTATERRNAVLLATKRAAAIGLRAGPVEATHSVRRHMPSICIQCR